MSGGSVVARVSYRFIEGGPYAGLEVLVVGGGNSAAEASLFLHEAGAHVKKLQMLECR